MKNTVNQFSSLAGIQRLSQFSTFIYIEIDQYTWTDSEDEHNLLPTTTTSCRSIESIFVDHSRVGDIVFGVVTL